MKQTWFKMSGKDNTATISIYDEIGMWGVSASDFRNSLNALGDNIKTINLDINSPGGVVYDGLAIYNMLKRHPATVNARVDGIAASIASVVAMAGDTIEMPENAMMMIHNPEGIVAGNSDDMKDMADLLDKIRDSVATTYMAKSGLGADRVAKMMADVTWMNAAEAKSNGFADKVVNASTVKNKFNLARHGAPEAVCRLYGDIKNEDTSPARTDPPQPDPKEVKDPPDDNKPDVEAAVKAATDAERKRIADITAACVLAKHPEKALEYMSSDKELSVIMAELAAIRVVKPENEINTNNGGATQPPDPSWGKVTNRLNKARLPQGKAA